MKNSGTDWKEVYETHRVTHELLRWRIKPPQQWHTVNTLISPPSLISPRLKLQVSNKPPFYKPSLNNKKVWTHGKYGVKSRFYSWSQHCQFRSSYWTVLGLSYLVRIQGYWWPLLVACICFRLEYGRVKDIQYCITLLETFQKKNDSSHGHQWVFKKPPSNKPTVISSPGAYYSVYGTFESKWTF